MTEMGTLCDGTPWSTRTKNGISGAAMVSFWNAQN